MSYFRKKIKCCFIGNFGVGKTSFIHSILGLSTKDVRTTLGIDFFTMTISFNNTTAYITLWDTAGSERFRSLMRSYVRDSNIVFIIYDLTDRNAMVSVVQCFRDLEHCKPEVVAVIGNKIDLKPLVTHDVYNTIKPWTRQGWNIVTGTCSARKAASTKKLFLRCLNNTVDSPKCSNVEAVPIRLLQRPVLSKKCCT